MKEELSQKDPEMGERLVEKLKQSPSVSQLSVVQIAAVTVRVDVNKR